ncbi:hypothetical protein GQF03_03535 [Sneathiella chungangensis]|uniref:Uncharacterized protein n=1 Tax=Sneathiella chungangensis TaxID=1418234 RepID=A0A845MCF5_9PROT|nr:hypothetical protein [Sneathiella chungangensis]MZR21395.1 hypothetical protein [Sneathiella chungangensis]
MFKHLSKWLLIFVVLGGLTGCACLIKLSIYGGQDTMTASPSSSEEFVAMGELKENIELTGFLGKTEYLYFPVEPPQVNQNIEWAIRDSLKNFGYLGSAVSRYKLSVRVEELDYTPSLNQPEGVDLCVYWGGRIGLSTGYTKLHYTLKDSVTGDILFDDTINNRYFFDKDTAATVAMGWAAVSFSIKENILELIENLKVIENQ